MKKFGFKTKAQWAYFKSALFGAAIGMMLAPAVADIRNSRKKMDSSVEKEASLSDFFAGISFGEKTKVLINGKTVAVCKGREEAEAAYKAARLMYNADGVRLLQLDVAYAPVDKERDKELVRDLQVKSGEELEQAVLAGLADCDRGKELAYTMRIDDYTVTVKHFQDLISILEEAQGKYDENDRFQVRLNPPASRNVTMYEVSVAQKQEEEMPSGKAQDETEENRESVHKILPAKVALTGADGEPEDTEGAGEDADTDGGAEDEGKEDAGSGKPDEPEGGAADSDSGSDKPERSGSQLADQAAEDGIKYVGFTEKIQVMETYVSKDQIKDKDTAYHEITEEKGEKSIYVVKPGDYLDLIASKTNMTVAEIKELNPGIESDENLYYDDRLNIMVPKAAVQVLVRRQETYQETYNEDVVYEDDDSMFIGETEVLEEGSPGTHIVTDLVTYNGELESGREQLQETVEVAAVAQVVRRGTKSKPTYMYPVTNWVVTSNFGYRWGRLHAGTDVGVPIGTTVRASRAGQISVAGWVGGYGNCVMIDHGDGITTVYGHLSEINCSVGQYVDQGQQIALSGNTGRSTGPHLHFEIRVNGVAEDAAPYLEGQK